MSADRSSPGRRASVWMLLVLFLLGSAVPAVSRMDCLVSGHSELSVGYANECCPEDADAPGPVIKAVCCEVLTAEPGKQPFAPQPPIVVPEQPAVVQVLGVHVPSVVLHQPGVHLGRRPPPTALAERLAVVGCFLI